MCDGQLGWAGAAVQDNVTRADSTQSMCVAVQTDCHTSTRLSGAGISLRPRRLIRCTDVPSSADQKLSAKIDGVDQKLSAKTESVKDLVTALAINMEKSFA